MLLEVLEDLSGGSLDEVSWRDRTEEKICSQSTVSAYSHHRRITSGDKTFNKTTAASSVRHHAGKHEQHGAAPASHYPESPSVPGEREAFNYRHEEERKKQIRQPLVRWRSPPPPTASRTEEIIPDGGRQQNIASVERCGAPSQRSGRHFLQGLERLLLSC
ncbi:unnamed protein product [Gadus morhua 'NCC']